MTELIRFLDDDRKGRWANILMDNGDPCWIGIAQTGILVKKSKVGLFGAKLYEEKDIYKAAKTAQLLNALYSDDLTPAEMWNPVLKSIANAVLHCKDLSEVARVLNEAEQEPEYQDRGKVIEADFLETASMSSEENGQQHEIVIPPQVKLVPILATLFGATGLFGKLPLLFWLGIALCIFNLMLAIQWRIIGSGWFVLICIGLARVAYLYFSVKPSLLETGAAGILLWTAFNMLYVLKRKTIKFSE